jgi:hypothetical protein
VSRLSFKTVVFIVAIFSTLVCGATASDATTDPQSAGVSTAGDAPLPSTTDTHPITYEEFAALTPQQRYERFAKLEDGNKAVLVRQHVENWLRQNRSRLSDGQIAVVEELELLLFERFADTNAVNDPEFNRRVDALEKKADCRLRQSDFSAVLGPMVPPLAEVPSWRDDLWAWVENCVAPRVLK